MKSDYNTNSATKKIITTECINILSQKRATGHVNYILTPNGVLKAFSQTPIALMFECKITLAFSIDEHFCKVIDCYTSKYIIQNKLDSKALQLLSIIRMLIIQNTCFLIEENNFFETIKKIFSNINNQNADILLGKALLELMKLNQFSLTNYFCCICNCEINLMHPHISMHGYHCSIHKQGSMNISFNNLKLLAYLYLLNVEAILFNPKYFKKLSTIIVFLILSSKNSKGL